MDSNHVEVVVVGAGPTGLMAAALLTRCGVRVRIFDKNPEQAHESRALAVQPRSLELFLGLGLADALMARGTLVTTARLVVGGKIEAELFFDDINRTDTPYSSMLIVPQRDTEAVLNDELKRLGRTVERSVEVTGFTETAEGVTVCARNGAGTDFEVQTSYILGADGAHSIVRKTLGLSFEGAAYPANFLLADCRIEGLPASDGMALFLHGKSFAAYFPLPEGPNLGRIVALHSAHAGDAQDPIETQGGKEATLPEVEKSFRAATNSQVRLSEPKWTSLYRVHHRGVDQYRKGRAFVAGDAAHIHSPAAGQGMNTGLQDSANLAWKLALALRRPGSDALLDTYHQERWPIGQIVLKETDKMFSTMTSQTGWFDSLRNSLLPQAAGVLSHLEIFRRRAFDFMSQLNIHYHPNVGVLDETGRGEDHFWRDGPGAGHRAPNAALSHNHDLFALIAGYHFSLLAFSRRPLAREEIALVEQSFSTLPAPSGVALQRHLIALSYCGIEGAFVRAASVQIFSTYGVNQSTPQALYLIRPDGYIAWRAAFFDFPALGKFLQATFC